MILFKFSRIYGFDPSIASKGWYPLPNAFVAGMPREIVLVDTAGAARQFHASSRGDRLYFRDGNYHLNAKSQELFDGLLYDRIVAACLLSR